MLLLVLRLLNLLRRLVLLSPLVLLGVLAVLRRNLLSTRLLGVVIVLHDVPFFQHTVIAQVYNLVIPERTGQKGYSLLSRVPYTVCAARRAMRFARAMMVRMGGLPIDRGSKLASAR